MYVYITSYLYGASPRADDRHPLALQRLGVVPARRVEGGAREVLDAWDHTGV